jgi:hypothetical protein
LIAIFEKWEMNGLPWEIRNMILDWVCVAPYMRYVCSLVCWDWHHVVKPKIECAPYQWTHVGYKYKYRTRQYFNETGSAAADGDLRMLQWLQSQQFQMDENTYNIAAASGHLHILQWLHANNYPWGSKIFTKAVKSRNYELIQWLYEKKPIINNRKVSILVGRGGDIGMLNMLHDWNTLTIEDVAEAAARFNNLDVVCWIIEKAHSHTYAHNIDSYLISGAVRGGHIHMLEYINNVQDIHYDSLDYGGPCIVCGTLVTLTALKWLHERGFVIPIWYVDVADVEGDLETLEWLLELWGDLICEKACQRAAKHKHFHVLKWLIAHGNTCNKKVFAYCILHGNLDMVQYLHDPTFLNNTKFTHIAASHGNLQMLQWLHKQNYAMHDDILDFAAESGNQAMIIWLMDLGYKFSEFTYEDLVESGNMSTLVWAESMGCTCESPKRIKCAYLNAVRNFDLQMLQYLYDKNLRSSSKRIWITAVEINMIKIVRWLQNHEFLCGSKSTTANFDS